MVENCVRKLSIALVLIAAIILGGCGSDKTDTYSYESEKAAIDAYLDSDEVASDNAEAVGSYSGDDGTYYFIQDAADDSEVVVHIAIIKEKDGKYLCKKYSPDYSSEAVSPEDGECRYFSIPFEDLYLNIGILDSDRYIVNVNGENIKVRDNGVFYYIDESDDVIFNCSDSE